MDISPIIISLKTAVISMIITFLLGIFVARVMVNIKYDKVKIVLDGILTLPLVLPPTVIGFLLLMIFGVNRPLGDFLLNFMGIRIVFSWWATVIASVVISFPLMYRSARGAFEQIDKNLVMAARTLGMSENKIFWKVIMPITLPGVVSGGILAFARGLGEFGATAMIAGNIINKTRTLPLAIYSEVAAGNMDMAGNYVLIVTIISFIIVVLTNYFTLKQRKYLK